MLINDFYTVHNHECAENKITAVIHFNAEHSIFTGHFPQQPVVPGVCMMQLVKELLQQQLGKSLIIRNTGQVKFLQLVLPDVQPSVAISWKEEATGYLVNASFKNETADVFKMTGVFEACES
ncbi:ApeI family dehydratase [Chitinophagaceae bacterium MMS25-I14]